MCIFAGFACHSFCKEKLSVNLEQKYESQTVESRPSTSLLYSPQSGTIRYAVTVLYLKPFLLSIKFFQNLRLTLEYCFILRVLLLNLVQRWNFQLQLPLWLRNIDGISKRNNLSPLMMPLLMDVSLTILSLQSAYQSIQVQVPTSV